MIGDELSANCMLYRAMDLIERGVIAFEGPKVNQFMSHTGDIGSIASELSKSLNSHDSDEATLKLFLHPARLLKAYIEYSLESNNGDLTKKRAIEEIGVHVFSGE